MDLRHRLDHFFRALSLQQLRMVNFNHFSHVTYNTLLYLDLIAYTENCTVSKLAELLRVAKSAVTLKVKEMEKLGLVTKTQSAEDRRVFYLHINESVAAEYQSLDNVFYRTLDELQSRYSPAQLSVLEDMLRTIEHHISTETALADPSERT